MKRALALAIAAVALFVANPAYSQGNAGTTTAKAAATILPVPALALLGSSAIHSTAVHTQVWTYPWHYKPFNFGSVINQGVNATGQYVSNVVNPNYYGETLHLTGPHKITKPDVGAHKTTAKYNIDSSRDKLAGKLAVGCIFGSAALTITAAIVKANAMGNPIRWRSQAEHERIVASGYEKQFELTNEEAQTAVTFCGGGAVYLMAQNRWTPAAAPRSR